MAQGSNANTKRLVNELKAAVEGGDSAKLDRARGDIMAASMGRDAPRTIRKLQAAIEDSSGYHRSSLDAVRAALKNFSFE